MEKVRVSIPGKVYDITIATGLMESLPEIFAGQYEGKKLAIVSDRTVYGLYGRDFARRLEASGLSVIAVVFDAGEQNKNLETLQKIYSALAEHAFTRSDVIIALGGGVTGDMAGLAAATFLRGTGFVQVPTTLLAMVDSSIGGKVAVDLPQGKNLVGTFYQPDAVYTDPGLLRTLDDRRFADGMGELLKHGFIYDDQLCESLVCLGSRRALEPYLDEFISRSCAIKRHMVEQDEQDQGIRQVLNFGHTIGHAIEKVQHFQGLSHGEAISVGMALITRLTEKIGLTIAGTADKIESILTQYALPTEMPDIHLSQLTEAIRVDKKSRSGKITIAYVEKIGKSGLHTMSLDAMEGLIHGHFDH